VTKFFLEKSLGIVLSSVYLSDTYIDTKTEFCPSKKKGLEEVVGKTGKYDTL
jgi:hypothetical protein